MRGKTAAAVGLLVLASSVCCLIAGCFVVAALKSGDCDGGCNSGSLLGVMIALFVAFPVVGAVMWMRSRRTFRGLGLIAMILSAAVLIPSAGLYAYYLYGSSKASVASHEMRTNQDDSYMLLSVRDLPNIGVPARKRCVFAAIDCDRRPLEIDAKCEQGDVRIPEADWPAFVRLPNEDFGLPPDDRIDRYPMSCAKPGGQAGQ